MAKVYAGTIALFLKFTRSIDPIQAHGSRFPAIEYGSRTWGDSLVNLAFFR